MYRLQLMLMLLFCATASLWAQDTETETDDSATTEEAAAAPVEGVTDEEIDELLGLEEDYTEADDDDFDPTQQVRFEQSIPFPTDI